MSHWALEPQDALRAVDAFPEGLIGAEAEKRLERHGRNELEEGRRGRPLTILLGQFTSPLIAILLVAAAVTLLLREFVDAGVIAAVLVLNAVIGFSQEYRAERSLEALRQLACAVARMVRDGRKRQIDAALLVPGDVVLVEAGTKVPADCRVLHAVALEVDESLLTGESTPVAKSTAPVPAETPLAALTIHARALYLPATQFPVERNNSGSRTGTLATRLPRIPDGRRDAADAPAAFPPQQLSGRPDSGEDAAS